MRRLFLVMALLLAGNAWAGGVELQDVRVWKSPDNTRVVLGLSGPVDYKVFTLENPHRVVVDIVDAYRGKQVSTAFNSSGYLLKIRTGVRHGDDLRLVFDLSAPARPRAILMPPFGPYDFRLMVDLTPPSGGPAPRTIAQAEPPPESEPPPQPSAKPAAAEPAPPAPAEPADPAVSTAFKPIVVAIDAGHGGEDPGAIGPSGLQEKKVTLQIARRLAERVNDTPGMRAYLTRTGDYYVGLRERMALARAHQADLFVSIHADAFYDRSVRGSSVYVLSENGASSEAARWLAKQENSADLLGGVSLDSKDPTLASVLLDLSQTAAIEASFHVARALLDELDDLGPVHMERVQQAAFVVLKSPDVPSVLVETAFITSPIGESRLQDPAHQSNIADSLMQGILEYFSEYRPQRLVAGTQRQYVIQPGDTLSEISIRYGVSMDALRSANALTSNTIRVGQVLQIPGTGS